MVRVVARLTPPGLSASRVAGLTAISMVAFAANSLLARIALMESGTDAASFTAIRLASGAMTLWAIARTRSGSPLEGNRAGALVLFAYAITFSFAYLGLPTGLGALIMFGAAQTTMIGYGLWRGERLGPLQALGLAGALAGLVVLTLPGTAGAPAGPSVLMLLSGLAWGAYCVLGNIGGDPLRVTAGNFVRCLPFAGLLLLLAFPRVEVDAVGLACAVLSGSLATGVAYAIWYTAIRELGTIASSVVQLTIPVLAGLAGVALLGESVTATLLIGTVCVLGGVAVVVLCRGRAGR